MRTVFQQSFGIDEEEFSLDGVLTTYYGLMFDGDVMDLEFRIQRELKTSFCLRELIEKALGERNLSDPLTDEAFADAQSRLPYLKRVDYPQQGNLTLEDLLTTRLLCQEIARRWEIDWVDPS